MTELELKQTEAWLTESEKEMNALRNRIKLLANLINALKQSAETFKDIQAKKFERIYELNETRKKAEELLAYYKEHPEEIE